MTDRALPTRDQVQAVLIAQKGNGKSAMVTAIRAMKSDYADLTDELLNMIIEDLNSYSEYVLEE